MCCFVDAADDDDVCQFVPHAATLYFKLWNFPSPNIRQIPLGFPKNDFHQEQNEFAADSLLTRIRDKDQKSVAGTRLQGS